MLRKKTNTTVNDLEIQNFAKFSEEWWNENGKYRILHVINPIRLSYIRDHITEHFNIKQSSKMSLNGLKVLDVGCGGGLVSVPLCRMGARVTGIDATTDNIEVARAYAKKQGLLISYLNSNAEELVRSRKAFDVVLALEVIEHVENKEYFLSCLAKLLNPGGLLFLSTINRNLKSLLLAKVVAEYVLGWVPRETHEWSKFVKPEEVQPLLDELDLKIIDISGISYKPLVNKWYLSDELDVNYIMCAYK